MRSVAEHQHAVEELLAPIARRPPEVVTGDFADPVLLGRILAEDLVSPIDHPPFDNSQMDGYAVRSSDVVPAAPLPVAARIAAGHAGPPLPPGRAAPIMTGAPIPDGADAVIPIEAATPDTFLPEEGQHHVGFAAPVTSGAYVRRRGSDLAAGGLLFAAGAVLGAAQWGAIAASGVTSVPLLRRVRVLVISTGDELRRGDGPLEPGQIHDANRTSMALAVAAAGGVPVPATAVTDDAAELTGALAASAPSVDLVLTTGGVSAGAYEVVRDVLEPAGVEFGGVAMQPGGPQGWGIAKLFDGDGVPFSVPVVCFPGNPVSALVSFEVFLGPVLRRTHGVRLRDAGLAPLAEAVTSPAVKHQVRRGRLSAAGEVEFVGGPSSHLLHHYATSALLVHIPVGASALEAGDEVEIWRIDE